MQLKFLQDPRIWVGAVSTLAVKLTDHMIGNVSYKCPSFHSGFGIDAPIGIGPHHPDFAATAGTAAAFEEAIKVAKAMAMMGARVLTDPDLARQAREDFEKPEVN